MLRLKIAGEKQVGVSLQPPKMEYSISFIRV